MAEKKVTVTIKCKQVIVYNQTKQMSVEDFNKLNSIHDDCVSQNENPEEYSLLEGYVNPQDVFDCEPEYTSFELYEVK